MSYGSTPPPPPPPGGGFPPAEDPVPPQSPWGAPAQPTQPTYPTAPPSYQAPAQPAAPEPPAAPAYPGYQAPAAPTYPGYQAPYQAAPGYPGAQPGYQQPTYQGGYPAAPMPGGYAPYGSQTGPGGDLAQWPQRAIGYLIDIALYIPGYILYALGAPKVDARGNVSGVGITYFIGALYILGMAIWNRWIKGGQGQTIGRKVAGVTLVNAQGQPLGAGMAFVRDLAHIIDGAICYIGYLFPLWDAKRQTIADKLLNTYVITVPK